MEKTFKFYNVIFALLLSVALFHSFANAKEVGGVGLSASRVITSPQEKQATLNVRNTSQDRYFLVQSWVENFQRQKVNDFIITPPLFVIKPRNENALRIVNAGAQLPADRETLYWVNVKAIPSSKEDATKNTLKIAIQNRIRLLVRPNDLPVKVADAPNMLHFKRSGNTLIVTNPSPYYLSLVNFHVGSVKLDSTTIAPLQETRLDLPPATQGTAVSYQTVDDYGSNTPEIRSSL